MNVATTARTSAPRGLRIHTLRTLPMMNVVGAGVFAQAWSARL